MTHAAAPFQLGAIADNGVAFNKAIGSINLAKLPIKRKLLVGRNQHAVHPAGTRFDVGDAVRRRTTETALPFSHQCLDVKGGQTRRRDTRRKLFNGQTEGARGGHGMQ